MATRNDKFDIRGINHLALVCKDMKRTVDFYSGVLGMPLTKTINLPRGMGQHFFFDIGNGDQLAFFWFPDAPQAAPGIGNAADLPGRGSLTSAHGSMNHVAIRVAPEHIEEYRARLVATGVDVTPVVNHDDVVTGKDARTSEQVTDRTWLRSCYFFDPDGIMLEFTATVNEATADVDLPVNAEGIKADGSLITGA